MVRQDSFSKKKILAATTLSCVLLSSMVPVLLYSAPVFAEEESSEEEEEASTEYIKLNVEVSYNYDVTEDEQIQPNVNIYYYGYSRGSATLLRSDQNERVWNIELSNYEKPNDSRNAYSLNVSNLPAGLDFRLKESYLDETGTTYRLVGVIDKVAEESDDGTTDDGTTDDGTIDDGTTDDGTTDGETTDDGTTDGETTDGETTDEGNDGITDTSDSEDTLEKPDSPEVKTVTTVETETVKEKMVPAKHALPQTSDISSLPIFAALGLGSVSSLVAAITRKKNK